jgi:hypothetical protein
MGKGRENDTQVFPHAFRTSGEINDQARTPDSHDRPGDYGMGSFFEAFSPHRFGKPRDFLLNDLQRCIGSHVPGAQARSSGGENQICLELISHFF